MTRLDDQHALITGGGTGIGAAIAAALAGAGARVTLVGRRKDVLDRTAAQLPGALAVAADVADREKVEIAFKRAREANGPLTILVNNAGLAPSAPFDKVSCNDWRAIMAINLDAIFHCCQAALADLLSAPAGRVVTIASTAGLKGYAYTAPYVASKHGAVGLMRALAAEYAETAFTANAVCPGFTDTDIVQASVAQISEKTGRNEQEARKALTRFNPQGRFVQPQEVANAVLWLCAPENRSITGQALAVAGGEV